jgi:predicted ATPase/transcriptional regulator with XRE-family HTH domain
MDRPPEHNTTTASRDARPPLFGHLLRQHRIASGWTQEELAQRANVSPRAISNYEGGATLRPQRETVRLLADALGLSDEDRALLTASVTAQRAKAITSLPSRTAPPTPSHVPAPLTPLLGREAELLSLTASLAQGNVRLMTVVGPGGAGKTRLALAAAAAAAVHGEYADGVYFVSLAPVREPEVLWSVAAQALGVKPAGAQSPYDALHAWLQNRRVLLVLDNCEHLLSEAAMVANLLAACPELAILATSRAPLRVRGEGEFPLAPLATPEQSAAMSAVAASPAGQVFVHYARAVQPEFRVTAENAATVAAICAHLEGLPLALELAAARTRWFTAAQLLERLTPRLATLVDGPRDVAPRQRTMRETIAWSDGLLTEEERRVFVSMAVFAGGATPDAVSAVCGDGATVHADALVLQNLLAITPGQDAAPRYGMLETVREYAGERAQVLGVAAESRRLHAGYFLALAEEARPRLRGPERGRWRRRVTVELDNLRAALRWAQDAGDAAMSLRLTHALQPYWRAQGYLREGAEWARIALEMSASAGPDMLALRAGALVSAGNLRYQMAEYAQSIALAHEGLALARAQGDEQTVADALWLLGLLATERSELEQARSYLEESLALFRRLDRPSSVARPQQPLE